MAQQDAVIRLLLVEDQLEDAEQLISMLRNGGMAVRPQRPESEQDMEKILGSQVIDMVIAAFDCKYIAFARAAKLVDSSLDSFRMGFSNVRSAHAPFIRCI